MGENAPIYYKIDMRITAVAIAALMFASQVYAGQPVEAKVSVCFTPAEQCEAKLVDAIDRVQSSHAL